MFNFRFCQKKQGHRNRQVFKSNRRHLILIKDSQFIFVALKIAEKVMHYQPATSCFEMANGGRSCWTKLAAWHIYVLYYVGNMALSHPGMSGQNCGFHTWYKCC